MEFFKKLGLQIQIILIVVFGILAAFLFLYLRGNLRLKKQMEYRLNRVIKETELTQLEADSKEKEERLATLKAEEKSIREKIKIIEEKDSEGKELTLTELEDFFNERGF